MQDETIKDYAYRSRHRRWKRCIPEPDMFEYYKPLKTAKHEPRERRPRYLAYLCTTPGRCYSDIGPVDVDHRLSPTTALYPLPVYHEWPKDAPVDLRFCYSARIPVIDLLQSFCLVMLHSTRWKYLTIEGQTNIIHIALRHRP